MRQCTKCQVVYHDKERSRCLYCESLLLAVDQQTETAGAGEVQPTKLQQQSHYVGRFYLAQNILSKILSDRGADDHGRTQYLVGGFFRNRTFHYLYNFSRQNYKRGQGFTRTLIQPVTTASFLMLPWFIYNVLNTIFLRMSLNAYCDKCGTKFARIGIEEHDQEECEYNREYHSIVDDIVLGKIPLTESKYKWLASQKMEKGKRSAYVDLCGTKRYLKPWTDILSIWISVVILMFSMIMIILPRAIDFINAFDYETELDSVDVEL